MNARHDDPQFRDLCRWKDLRWLVIAVFGAVLIAVALLAADVAEAGGTVTDSHYVQLQRSGVTLTDVTTPKLACPKPKTVLECLACMADMVEAEIAKRTSGYVTYRCLDVSQKYAKFSTSAPPVVPPPVAMTQVYACPEAGADGRILESASVQWPNCPSAAYQNPSKALVVATNGGTQPLYWRLAAKVTDGRVWTQTGTVVDWKRVEDIDWGLAPGRVTLSWTPPTKNVDGTALTNLAGHRILYGTAPTALTQTISVPGAVSVYIVENLSPGAYYFAVRAYTTDGSEGVNSNIAQKTIQ